MSGQARATVAAAADLVVTLSIAQRTALVYGSGHHMAQNAAQRVAAALERASALEAPLHLRFSPRHVFLGHRNLGAGHQVLRNIADRFWRRGVAGLTIQRDATAEGLVGLLQALNEAVRRRASREEGERLLREARPQGVELHFLRQLLTHEVRDEVTALSPEEAQRQWDELMARLEQLTGPLVLAPGVPYHAGGNGRPDLATLVFERLRTLETEPREEVEVGRRVGELVGSMDATLRRQLVAAAMKAVDVTPESLERFVGLVGHETLLEVLRRLDEAGAAVSPAALRALSMLSLTVRRTATAGSTAGGTGPAAGELFAEELDVLLEGMLRDQEADPFTSEELAHLLRRAESAAERLAAQPVAEATELPLRAEDGERQFTLVARQLLRDAEHDAELGAAVCREGQRSWLRLLDAGATRGLDEAMRLAREAGEQSGQAASEAWAWEHPEVLARLRDRLTEATRWTAESTIDQLTAIGPAAVPLLVEVLATSESLAVRRRALAVLEGMPQSPAPQLLPLLDPEQPWYLQRNALYVLRRRRDPAGAEAAAALWKGAAPRLRVELLGYLLAVEAPAGLRFLEEALAGDEDATLEAARLALKTPAREVIVAVVRRAEEVPADLVGGKLHMALLRALAASKHPQALHYVAELPARRVPVLPWQRGRYRREIDALVARSR